METRIPSSLPNPRCGLRLYRATPEDPGQLVMVTFDEGIQTAEVVDGEDAGEVMLVSEMGGEFCEVR
jgi:hypothetical protein